MKASNGKPPAIVGKIGGKIGGKIHGSSHGKGMHVQRVPGKPYGPRKKAAPPSAVAKYPPGYFTELIRLHNWPPSFESCGMVVTWRDSAEASRRTSAARNDAIEAGRGYALASVMLPGTAKYAAPGWTA
jgi:hypothetical protein